MALLFLSESDVTRLLSMSDAIRAMRLAFESLAKGEAQNQARRRLILPAGSVLHSMAGAYGGYFGTKIYATNPGRGAHFLFVLYRAEDAAPLALLEANHLGQIRTGATTGLATGVLARPEAATLGLIGSGFQARTQLEAVLAVRPIRAVRVWSRTAEKRERFAKECSDRFRVPVDAADSARRAIEGADVVVTATSSRDPVLEADWIRPGTHIDAVGSNQSKRRELPAELVHRANLVVVDSIEQARAESGDLLLAFDEKDWSSPRLVELKDMVLGSQKRAPGDITVFKSNGLGLEDVAAAAWVYERARETGTGKELPLFHS